MLQRVDEAVLSAQDALARDPTNAWGYRLLSIGLMGQDRMHARELLADPSRKVTRPRSRAGRGAVRAARARELHRAGRSCGQEPAIRAGGQRGRATPTELAPESAEAHNSVAYVALAMHEFGRAEDAAREALARDPQCAAAESNLAVALHHTGRPRAKRPTCCATRAVHPTKFGDRFTEYLKARRQHALLLVAGLAMIAAAVAAGAGAASALILVLYVGIGAASRATGADHPGSGHGS